MAKGKHIDGQVAGGEKGRGVLLVARGVERPSELIALEMLVLPRPKWS